MVNLKTARELALSHEGAVSLPHFERESFRVNGKIFATLDEKSGLMMVSLSEMDQSLFSLHDNTIIYPVPNAWGKKGATYIELKKVRKEVLKDAIQSAYDRVMTKKKK